MKLKFFVISLFVIFTLNAQNSKLINLQSQRETSLKEIEVTNKMLSQTSNSRKNALSRLSLLAQQIMSRKKVISTLNQEIEVLNQSIKQIEREIKSLEKELDSKKKSYAESVRQVYYHKSSQDRLLFILSGEDFAQSYRRMRYLKEYSDWQKQQGKEITSKQDELKKQNQKLVDSKKDKLVLMSQKEKEENNLKREESTQQSTVKTLTAKEKDLQKELNKKRQQANELNRQIERAIAEEIQRANAEAEKARKANAEAEKSQKTNQIRDVRKAETAGGYAMTKEEQQLSSDFSANRGKLPYPLKGSYRITSRFGEQQHQNLKHVKTNNNGIDIQTTPNNDAKAVFGGVVSRIFVVPGFNNSVIIRHGNYLTVYANLSDVYVKTNDKVKTGQSIGKIFTDKEDGNITSLHFELWKERTKLNPMSWLIK